MKALCATLMSLLMLVAQVFAAVPPPAVAQEGQPADSACCGIIRQNCCACCLAAPVASVPVAATVPAPAAKTTVPVFQAIAWLTVASLLPDASCLEASPARESPPPASSAVPLFLRHRTLLI